MESIVCRFFFDRGSIDQVWAQVISVYSDVLLVLSNNHHKTSLSLGGGFTDFYVHSYLGERSILTNISQMGWNHQLELLLTRMPKENKPWTIDFSLPTSSSKRCSESQQTGKTLDIRLRTEGYNVPLIWAMKKKAPRGCLGVYLVGTKFSMRQTARWQPRSRGEWDLILIIWNPSNSVSSTVSRKVRFTTFTSGFNTLGETVSMSFGDSGGTGWGDKIFYI